MYKYHVPPEFMNAVTDRELVKSKHYSSVLRRFERALHSDSFGLSRWSVKHSSSI
jgi:hypothetical protein